MTRMKSFVRPKNFRLKAAIVRSGFTYRDVAGRIGIREIRLSFIVTGRIVPKPEEQRALAVLLETPMSELFPADEALAS